MSYFNPKKIPARLICLLIVLLTAVNTYAQLGGSEQLSTTNKKAIKLYHDALNDYDARKDDEALELLDKALKKDTSFIEAHMVKAYIYSDHHKDNMAMAELKRAININPDFFPNNFFTLAQLEISHGKYAAAKANYKAFLKYPTNSKRMHDLSVLGIKDCDFAANAMKHPVDFHPVNMGPGINSQFDEYFPAITADGQTFLITRDIKDNMAMAGHQEDFFVSKKVGGQWQKAINMGGPINTHGNEGAPTLSADGQLLIFAGCDRSDGYGSCDLYYSFRAGHRWTRPRNLGRPVNTANWETQPSLSSDGKTLYFIRGIITRKGVQDQDIYETQLSDSGTWSEPRRLSDSINTTEREASVCIAPDNQTLYFASDGHVGMGGLDLYMSRRRPDGHWGTPVDLGYPINTYRNENSVLVDPNGKLAYFASDRDGGYGGLDLYSFKLPANVQPNKITYVKGKVYDSRTNKPLDAEFQLIDLATGKTVVESESNVVDGQFLVCLPLNKDYALHVSKPGYLFYSENYSLKNIKDVTKPYKMNVPLEPIDTGMTVALRNIFFETNKYNLKPESDVELNKLISFLKQNPKLRIQISGYTDNVGDDKSNMILSENRAKAVYDYLIQHKIAATRLTYKGYGETRPVAPNDTPENRAKNRRTEFKVIGL